MCTVRVKSEPFVEAMGSRGISKSNDPISRKGAAVLFKSMRITKADILKLEQLQKEAGGIQCVRTIINYLRRGEISMAQNVRKIEGDKTRVYKDVELQLYKMFGCRAHGVKNCDDWLCAKLKPE